MPDPIMATAHDTWAAFPCLFPPKRTMSFLAFEKASFKAPEGPFLFFLGEQLGRDSPPLLPLGVSDLSSPYNDIGFFAPAQHLVHL